MQVFVLSYADAYEGEGVLGVFGTAEKAMKSAEAENHLAEVGRQPWEYHADVNYVMCNSIEKNRHGACATTLIVTPYEVQ